MKKKYSSSILTCVLSITFLFTVGIYNLYGNNKGWKAGCSRIKITPEESIWLAGYDSREHPSQGKLHDLWAKALAIEDADGNRGVLITTDILGFPKEMSDYIRDSIKVKYNLSRAQIILNSTHTHTGPALKGGTSENYILPSEQEKRIERYSDKLPGQIIKLVGEALSSMEPVNLYAQNGITRFQVNRRNNNEKTLTSFTELRGPNDYAVPVIKIENNTGKLIAVVFGYACHATVLNTFELSGDYPGFAQIELEKLYPGTTALFFQGAGGDQNPLPRRSVALAQQYGLELAAAVKRVLDEDMKQLPPYLSTAYSEIELQLATPPTKDELLEIAKNYSGPDKREKHWASMMLEQIEKSGSLRTSYPYPVQVWKLGTQPLISLGGEVVIDYSISLKQIFGEDIFVMGYSNDVMAYIPSSRVLMEGGYEGEASQKYSYGLPSVWKANTEPLIIEKVLELCEQAGIKLSK